MKTFRLFLGLLLVLGTMAVLPAVSIADPPPSSIGSYQLADPQGWDTVTYSVYYTQGGWNVTLLYWGPSGTNTGSETNPYPSQVDHDTVPVEDKGICVNVPASNHEFYSANMYYKYKLYNVRKTSAPVKTETIYTNNFQVYVPDRNP